MPGAWGLAEPILDSHGLAVASLSLEWALPGNGAKLDVETLASALLEAPPAISTRLGYKD